MKYFFKYGIYKFDSFTNNEKLKELLSNLEKDYYTNKITNIQYEITQLELFLSKNSYKKLLEEVQRKSELVFKAKLSEKYSAIVKQNYNLNDFKTKYVSFSNEYPVTLSTCDAITDCIAEGFCFDYVIIDEASMGSIIPSIYPFSVAKNIIVVGDQKQLKNITFSEEEMNEQIVVEPEYDYFKQNILSSLELVYGQKLPTTLLKEHYRCHPMIINFCNKQFYDDELVIMTDDTVVKKPLVLVETSDGNHMKFDFDKKVFNQREIDSALSDEIRNLVPELTELKTLGYATPFRRQADKAIHTIKIRQQDIEADTVHKFQGRECEGIFFSTVLDNKGSKKHYEFVELDSLVNVAVSRAEKLFVLNSSVKEFKKKNGTIASLIRYIEYYGDYSLNSKSSVRSIFDLLTSDFKEELRKKELTFRKKHSKYASENLMMDLIDTVLQDEAFRDFVCKPEYEIRKLTRDFSVLSIEEQKYVKNGARLDFVFYYKSGNEPIAAIEVDGHKYHCMPKQKEKDESKDSILKKLGIDIKRFSTNGSEEEKELRVFLTNILLSQNSNSH